jgi:hypothetical protein
MTARQALRRLRKRLQTMDRPGYFPALACNALTHKEAVALALAGFSLAGVRARDFLDAHVRQQRRERRLQHAAGLALDQELPAVLTAMGIAMTRRSS